MPFKCKKKSKYVKKSTLNEKTGIELAGEEYLNLHRRLYNQTDFDRIFPSQKYEGFNLFELIKKSNGKSCTPSKECVKRTFYNRFPVIKWLKNYKKEFFLPDLLAGITVSLLFVIFYYLSVIDYFSYFLIRSELCRKIF